LHSIFFIEHVQFTGRAEPNYRNLKISFDFSKKNSTLKISDNYSFETECLLYRSSHKILIISACPIVDLHVFKIKYSEIY